MKFFNLNNKKLKDTALGYVSRYDKENNKLYILFMINHTKDKLGDIFNFIIDECIKIRGIEYNKLHKDISHENIIDNNLKQPNTIPILLILKEPNKILKFLRKIFFIKELDYISKTIDLDTHRLNDNNFKLSQIDISVSDIAPILFHDRGVYPGEYIVIYDSPILYLSQDYEFKIISKNKYNIIKILKILGLSIVYAYLLPIVVIPIFIIPGIFQ